MRPESSNAPATAGCATHQLLPLAVHCKAGTQADTARGNYLAVMRLTDLGQGRHGKKAEKLDSESDDDSDMEESEEEEVDDKEPPAKMHLKMVSHMGGINRIRYADALAA